MNSAEAIREWLHGDGIVCPKCDGRGEDIEWGGQCQMCEGKKTALPHASFREFYGGNVVKIRRQDGKEVTVASSTFQALANDAVWSESDA